MWIPVFPAPLKNLMPLTNPSAAGTNLTPSSTFEASLVALDVRHALAEERAGARYGDADQNRCTEVGGVVAGADLDGRGAAAADHA